MTTPGPENVPAAVAALVERVGAWPSIRLTTSASEVAVDATDGRRLATLDLNSSTLEVMIPPDAVSQLTADRPRLRRSPNGISVDVVDVDGQAQAEWLLHRRLDVERNLDQYRTRSP